MYTVAVRALCEFAAKEGDLDLRFTPSPSAQEGMAGHAVVASRRGAGHRSEVALTGAYKTLTVRGRADGYDPGRGRVEEVKTHRGELAALPANHRQLHWAQLRVYAHLLCAQLGLDAMQLALVYFEIASQRETVLEETRSAADLRDFFERLCERFLQWSDQELAHRAARDQTLADLGFPHAAFRTGQRPLSEAVYRAAVHQRCLMAQAPTGIGKTIGSLFPLLKAAPRQRLDKVFFLTAKTSGRQLALDAMAQLQSDTPRLRVLELVARDKACEHPDKACHGESCPLARGFYDRLPQARQAAVERITLDKTTLRQVAREHAVCPYYLGQELARWSDVIVGDYTHYFDASAMLWGLALANEWRVGVLVDEAHNLVERARGMYSAELRQHRLDALRRSAPAALKPALDRLHRAWNALNRTQSADHEVHPQVPAPFAQALQQAIGAISERFAAEPTQHDPALAEFHFDALHFARLIESFDSHSLFDATRDDTTRAARPRTTLAIRNLVPAPFLQPRFAAAQSATLFSATLSPRRFYADTLGLPADAAWIDVESPFSPAQLSVRIARHISTRYPHRERSAAPIVELMAAQYDDRPGNYLAFFSSFDYLQQVAALFARCHPAVPAWLQSRGMGEAEREAFLARFVPEGAGIGFAVLGGAFAEGIDLPGRRLIGAFIATLGLPQVNPLNEQMRERLQARFGAGYDYTYLFPGLRKVVQAAGRVIRTTSDQGVVHLIDDRYARPEVRRLLPDWWQVETGARRPVPSRSVRTPEIEAPDVRPASRDGAMRPSTQDGALQRPVRGALTVPDRPR
jgi:Rad3-related DNA helicase